MTLPTFIVDGEGRGFRAEVDKENSLHVTAHQEPPLEPLLMKPFRQYFTDDGTATGSNDMGVDGSSTNQDFYIEADSDDDRYISAMSFIVAYGTSGQPFNWADGTALTNGTRIFYESKRGEIDIHDGIQSNQDMFRLSSQKIDADWQVRGVNATNDYGYFIWVDLKAFGFPFGVKLDRGSNQRITIRIRDNVGTDADTFDCIAYGFDRFESV
jgi:hypothetical protein